MTPTPKHPHICFIADGRSPTARSWLRHVLALGYRASLISTFPCQPPDGLADFHVLPVAFSRFSGGAPASPQTNALGPASRLKKFVRRFAPLFQALRYYIGPLTLFRYARPYRELLNTIQPDLVHALRIPFEGMLGSATPIGIPFLAATWGNDLTLHARGSLLMRRFTRRCLRRADGLTSDTHRDVRLAHEWGLSAGAPTLVVPGSGGLDLNAIRKAPAAGMESKPYPYPGPWIVNPRGLRPGSVHQDVFFAAIPRVLAVRPEARFICPGLAGKKQAENWVHQQDIRSQVYLLPKLSQTELWGLFKASALFVSPSSHDGTPNTLLEAMACGCFPIAGDIESLREWITSGENGLLVNPRDPEALAQAILQALDQPALRQTAARQNQDIIQARAAQSATQPQIDAFYRQFSG
jgi:glycosyltransferase involved in cell wall biosynthesis